VCAVVRQWTGQHGGNCPEPPTVTGWWRFEFPKQHLEMVQLCAEHAAALAGNDQLTLT
jgi:hypothetical protein